MHILVSTLTIGMPIAYTTCIYTTQHVAWFVRDTTKSGGWFCGTHIITDTLHSEIYPSSSTFSASCWVRLQFQENEIIFHWRE